MGILQKYLISVNNFQVNVSKSYYSLKKVSAKFFRQTFSYIELRVLQNSQTGQGPLSRLSWYKKIILVKILNFLETVGVNWEWFRSVNSFFQQNNTYQMSKENSLDNSYYYCYKFPVKSRAAS